MFRRKRNDFTPIPMQSGPPRTRKGYSPAHWVMIGLLLLVATIWIVSAVAAAMQ